MDIDVSNGFELGCFHFKVENNRETTMQLRERRRFGECDFANHIVRISEDYEPTQYHETFLHELLEATNEIWANGKMKHDEIASIANGLAQALKSLGVNFVHGG